MNAAPARALARDLETAFAPVDGALMVAGERLGEAVRRLEAIHAGLEGLRDTLDGPALAHATARLSAAAAAVEALAGGLRAEGEALARLDGRLGAVGDCIAALVKAHDGLSLLAMNALMVTAELDAGGEGLTSFALELRRLVRTAEGVLRGHARAQAAGLAQLRLAAAAQREFEQRQGPALREVAGRVRGSVGDVAARRGEAGAAAGRLGQRGLSVARAVSEVVAALQVGDATRQRIEHVVDGLDALAAGMEGAPLPWCAGLDAAPRMALAGRGMALQAALLRDAGATLEAEVARIRRATTSLAQDAGALVKTGAEVFGGAARGHSFLGALERDLGDAMALLDACHLRRQAVEKVARGVDTLLAELSEGLPRIQSLATDLRLVGLNAAFRCTRLGQRGLALSAVARELRGVAAAMTQGVQSLSDAIGETLAERGRDAVAGAGGLDATLGAMREGLAALQGASGVMDESIRALGTGGQEAAQLLATLGEALAPTRLLAARMRAAADQAAPDEAAPVPAELLRGRLGLVNAATFTMARERDIAREHGAELPEAAEALEDMLF